MIVHPNAKTNTRCLKYNSVTIFPSVNSFGSKITLNYRFNGSDVFKTTSMAFIVGPVHIVMFCYHFEF